MRYHTFSMEFKSGDWRGHVGTEMWFSCFHSFDWWDLWTVALSPEVSKNCHGNAS